MAALEKLKSSENVTNIIVSNDDELIFEKKLLIAILERAIRDFLASSNQLHNSAKEWFYSKDQDFIFSYLNISRTLGFNSDKLIERLNLLRTVARKNRRNSREIYRILSDLLESN